MNNIVASDRANLPALVSLVARAEFGVDDPDLGITFLTRKGQLVAAVVPADIATDALTSNGIPYSLEAWRLADRINAWRAGQRGRRLSDLPARDLGQAVAYALALQAVVLYEGGPDVYEAGTSPDKLEWVAYAFAKAEEISQNCTAWSTTRNGRKHPEGMIMSEAHYADVDWDHGTIAVLDTDGRPIVSSTIAADFDHDADDSYDDQRRLVTAALAALGWEPVPHEEWTDLETGRTVTLGALRVPVQAIEERA